MHPPEVLDRLLRLWAHRQELLEALDRLPRVLIHNDAFRRNLFLRSGRLFAVDWAFLGSGPIGAELAPLVTASVAFRGMARDRWRDLEQTAVEAYRRGLQDAGWRGASDQLRFGFAASSALRYGPGCVRLVLPALPDETAQPHVELVLGISSDKVLQLWARRLPRAGPTRRRRVQALRRARCMKAPAARASRAGRCDEFGAAVSRYQTWKRGR